MPFTAGVYALPAGNPVVTATTIQSSWANTTLSDIGTALSSCVLKDGTQTITANIPMAGFKFTGLGAGSSAGNSLRYEQVFSTSAISPLGPIAFTTATGLTAAGTIQSDALEVTSQVNRFSTVASGTGAKLLSTATAGIFQVIYNGGANPMKVYPALGGTINSLAANAGHTLATNTTCMYFATSATAWVAILSA